MTAAWQSELFNADAGRSEELDQTFQWPNLSGITELAIDTETTGLNTFEDVPVGFAVAAGKNLDDSWYVPFGHHRGANVEQEKACTWLADSVRGKDIWMHNAPFDVKMLRRVGVDLEELGCRIHDTQFPAALLDTKRRKFSLDVLSLDFLGRRKLELPPSPYKIHQMLPSTVSPYARNDASLTFQLKEHFRPQIEKWGLEKVLELEDALLYCTINMEQNGVRIDWDRLHLWRWEMRQRYQWCIMEIKRLTGLLISPTRSSDLAKLFRHLGLDYDRTATGLPSFTKMSLKDAAKKYPPVALADEARSIDSLDTKFMAKYEDCRMPDDRIHYKLNQLKSDEYGTISGRYSSSSGQKSEGWKGVNCQQQFDSERLPEALKGWPPRSLWLPDEGQDWLSADAKQIEFRLFAHFSKASWVLQRYAEDPLVDFHGVVLDQLRELGIELSPDPKVFRKHVKNVNFGIMYGMGAQTMSEKFDVELDQAKRAIKGWKKAFPEGVELLDMASRKAKERGWVKTLLGRMRFFNKTDDAYHAAISSVLSGSAADVMKVKLLKLYEMRKTYGFKMLHTVHDEANLSVPKDPEVVTAVQKALDEQDFELRVPILWDVQVGESWDM